jgi:hypothetical protein
MPKEKRNNLAIYTLAGSILLSSVIVSMNQSNAHSKDSSSISRLKTCVNNNFELIQMNIISGVSVGYARC